MRRKNDKKKEVKKDDETNYKEMEFDKL